MMREAEIRPRELFNRLLDLSDRDIRRFFGDKLRFVDVPCPGCGSCRRELGMEKLGFKYVTCLDCRSLFLSPRPTAEMIGAYYRESEAVKFWETDFFKETAEPRREKMFRPRAALVAEIADREGVGPSEAFADIGSGYGIFLEEVARLKRFTKVMGIEPAPNLAAVCRNKGFTVLQRPVEEVEQHEIDASVATAFEVLEHPFDPLAFLLGARRVLRPGGILLLTTLTVTGFDIQVLWDHSKSVYPPHHINLLSIPGIKNLVQRAGLELVELSTPGLLDVDIVRNIVEENRAILLPRFLRHLVQEASDEVRESFQRFLQRSCLSSHVRVVARVPGPGVQTSRFE